MLIYFSDKSADQTNPAEILGASKSFLIWRLKRYVMHPTYVQLSARAILTKNIFELVCSYECFLNVVSPLGWIFLSYVIFISDVSSFTDQILGCDSETWWLFSKLNAVTKVMTAGLRMTKAAIFVVSNLQGYCLVEYGIYHLCIWSQI